MRPRTGSPSIWNAPTTSSGIGVSGMGPNIGCVGPVASNPPLYGEGQLAAGEQGGEVAILTDLSTPAHTAPPWPLTRPVPPHSGREIKTRRRAGTPANRP